MKIYSFLKFEKVLSLIISSMTKPDIRKSRLKRKWSICKKGNIINFILLRHGLMVTVVCFGQDYP